jgi:hypothetical protein
LTRDADGDGITDRVELAGWHTMMGNVFVTDPDKPDSDNDGLTDGDEAGLVVVGDAAGGTGTSTRPIYAGHSDPLRRDTDRDGLSDGAEADLSLNPLNSDSDGDGIDDAREENVVGSDPGVADTDADGFNDGFEDANRKSKGLDPLSVDVKVSRISYARDFAIGSVLGDAWRKDSMAWLAGNLASGASSSIPVIGWVVGPLADARDAMASAIRGDWVGSGFSAAGAVPYSGDAVELPGKATRFVVRNPDLGPSAAAVIASIPKISEDVAFRAVKAVEPSAADLVSAGASKGSIMRLAKGRTDLDELADAIRRPGHVRGATARFFTDWRDGEKFLEDLFRAQGRVPTSQVFYHTTGCGKLCSMYGRRFDVLVDGVAHESKVSYTYLSPSLEMQIRSDAWLIKQGEIKGAHWHFFASTYGDKLGADTRVLDLLDEVGIPYTIHLPKD